MRLFRIAPAFELLMLAVLMSGEPALQLTAWVVSKANEYARHHGLATFVAYQGQWSLLHRDLEREITPMCRAEGMALLPYGVLGQGKFKTKQEVAERAAAGMKLRTFWGTSAQSEKEEAISRVLEEVATDLGATSLSQVAVAYHLHKCPYVFPIIGCRTVEQLRANMGVSVTGLAAFPCEYAELTYSRPPRNAAGSRSSSFAREHVPAGDRAAL